MDSFLRAYEALSETGVCDAPGGQEYERVFSEWLQAGKPEPYGFIRKHANQGPWDGKSIH